MQSTRSFTESCYCEKHHQILHHKEDAVNLLPQLLDQLIILGDMAREVSHALGGNGHRKEAIDFVFAERK